MEEGDIFNIPTGIFRGFENIGNDYGMIMAILGGDDAGGVLVDVEDDLASIFSSVHAVGKYTARRAGIGLNIGYQI